MDYETCTQGGGDGHRRKSTCGHNVRCSDPPNIVAILRNSECFGKRQHSFSQLPRGFVNNYQERFKDVRGVPLAVHELSQLVKDENFNLQNQQLRSLISVLAELPEDNRTSATLEIFYSGGVEVCAEILVKGFYDMSKDIRKHTEIMVVEHQDQKLVKDIIEIMHQTGRSIPVVISHLCKNEHLLHFLFSVLVLEAGSKLYSDATILLEEIFLSEPKSVYIDMKKIACLPVVLNKSMHHIQQAHVYHILVSAIAVGESILGVDSTLEEYEQWLLDDSKAKLNVQNQEYLLSFPNFLANLFRVATVPVNIAIPNSFSQILFRILGNEVQVSDAEIDAEMLNEDMRTHPIYQAALYCEKSARADAYLMLSTLLTGQCRSQMQEFVVKYDLVRGLENSIDNLVWSQSITGQQPPTNLQDNEGADQSIRIHYFRLIYSILDHHIHRYLLLNQQELEEIREISVTCNTDLPEGFDTFDRSKCCVKETGLLVDIIERIKKETCTSYYRFWMARTLESFLRGSRCTYDQIFLLRRGLLEELFEVLLLHRYATSDVLQGHFDLLASLMKDNEMAFEKCLKIIDSKTKFSMLCGVIESNLVDSNMFVRSMILSLHHFQSFGDKYNDFIKTSQLLSHYVPIRKRVEVIFNLVQILDIKTLSQENVSCLNTSIITLLIADIDGTLPEYLAAIASYTQDLVTTGKELLRKLRELLDFWLKHYSYSFKRRDIKSLEEATGFKFERWKEIVRELIKNDRSSPSAIVRYLECTESAKLTPICSLKLACSRTC